ncbi:hypothetical protein ZWY2020_000831 [Hordeum vulgare]|uniref:Uncharacterized protein n=1 Tax=Hordeum vulgare subsp. vulgare TaxID=112509 RepID=A0A8I6ZEY3_HORVV|nr:hypothetical protein ZWY2020_000831 [Hordeum vulgare]
MAAAARLSDDEIRLIVAQGVDAPLEETMRKLQSAVSDALHGGECHAHRRIPTLKQLEWADDTEGSARLVAQDMAQYAEDHRAYAADFAGRPGEEARAIAAALLGMAAWEDERQADALEIVLSTLRLRGRYLRALAAEADDMEPEDLVCYAASEFLCFLSKETGGGSVPNGEDAADAARADAMDAAARAGGGVGARFTERFLTLAEKLRHGAAFYARLPGQEPLAEALWRLVAAVEALCADPDELVAKMLASASWMLWRTLNRLALQDSYDLARLKI